MWGTGAFRLTDVLGWSDVVSHQEHGSRLRGMIWAAGARRRLTRAMAAVPLGESARSLLADGAAWFESWLEHHDPEAPFWEPYRFGAALTQVTVPVLLIGGWQDSFLSQTLEQYQVLRGRGVDVGLTVGPWTHAQLTATGAGRVARESLEWLDRALGRCSYRHGPESSARVHHRRRLGRAAGLAAADVSASALSGAGCGVELHCPPPDTGGSSTFTYDPADPTPILGGPLVLAAKGGYREDSRLARRADVLSFTSDPLPSDLYVVGHPVVELSHAADTPHVDVAVRVSEVDSRGRSRNVSDGYRRVTTSSEPGGVHVELEAVAHRFRAGSRSGCSSPAAPTRGSTAT